MVVCHCRAVSDGCIRSAVERGALDIDAVARQCGAGSVCGGCRPTIALLLAGGCPLAGGSGADLEPVAAVSPEPRASWGRAGGGQWRLSNS